MNNTNCKPKAAERPPFFFTLKGKDDILFLGKGGGLEK